MHPLWLDFMKKILILLTVGLLFAGSANAQVKFGLKGGLNVTDMHISQLSENFDKSNRAGWFIGPTVKFSLPVTGLGIDVSALYNYKSTKMKCLESETEGYDNGNNTNGYYTDEQNVKQQSIDIPVNLRYGVGLGSVASVFLFAGPQWSFNIGNKDFKWDNTSSYSLKRSNFSVNVGVGAMLVKHLQLSVNYNIACGKTADVNAWDVTRNVLSKTHSRNNTWQMGVAYYF